MSTVAGPSAPSGKAAFERVEAVGALGGVAERAEHGRLAAVLRDPERADQDRPR